MMMAREEAKKITIPQEFTHLKWKFSSLKSHILQSKCSSPERCTNSSASGDGIQQCTFCSYNRTLTLPSLPDMVFANNYLRLTHEDGYGIEYTALEALRLVDNKHDLMQVAGSKAWREARADSEHIREVVKPFDWTFTTNYKGTIIGNTKQIQVLQTDEIIDIEKLKRREKILFYDDVHLFEDELADNGSASCSAKIRVMPSGFFILLRFYLRVDNVLIRINDTRLHHEFGNDYMLREYTSREKDADQLKLPATVLTDPNEIWPYLSLKEEFNEKLILP